MALISVDWQLYFLLAAVFWRELSVSGLQLKFEFTDGFEMMQKAWCLIEEVLYCFSRSFITF